MANVINKCCGVNRLHLPSPSLFPLPLLRQNNSFLSLFPSGITVVSLQLKCCSLKIEVLAFYNTFRQFRFTQKVIYCLCCFGRIKCLREFVNNFDAFFPPSSSSCDGVGCITHFQKVFDSWQWNIQSNFLWVFFFPGGYLKLSGQ